MLTALAFLAAYTSGCVLALVRHPIFGLVTYVGLLYVHPPARWWGSIIPSLRWSLLAAAVTLIAVFIHQRDKQGPGIFSFGLMRGLVVFIIWLILQYFWAIDPESHMDLMTLTIKYTVLVYLIYSCIDSVTNLRIFLWAHAVGCFYLGTIVFQLYIGGRFEGFHGPGIDEANAAGLQIVTGVIVTFALFLSGSKIEKLGAFGGMPFTLNALVATISRSGFLALGIAGVLFNLFSSSKIKKTVLGYSIAGLVLFLMLTNPIYWSRISTITEGGEELEGVDTGYGRVVLLQAQMEMFAEHPLGCGHRCTAVLSPHYLEDRYLTGPAGNRARSSHNTFFSLLVEQGVVGAVIYVLLLVWIARTVFRLRSRMKNGDETLAVTYTAVVSILGAITVGDMFVDYLKFEARFWFLAVLMVLVKLETGGRNEASAGPT